MNSHIIASFFIEISISSSQVIAWHSLQWNCRFSSFDLSTAVFGFWSTRVRLSSTYSDEILHLILCFKPKYPMTRWRHSHSNVIHLRFSMWQCQVNYFSCSKLFFLKHPSQVFARFHCKQLLDWERVLWYDVYYELMSELRYQSLLPFEWLIIVGYY